MHTAIGIPTSINTIAIADDDPLPPEHTTSAPWISDNTWEEKESKHLDASLFLFLESPSTVSYG